MERGRNSGPSALQVPDWEFHSRRGMSPMRFVAERCLAAARERLLRAATRDDVTSVAVELGFGHVGRFAQLYRKAFGEVPSETLKRVEVRGRDRR